MRKLRYFKMGEKCPNREDYPYLLLWSWEEATCKTTCFYEKGGVGEGNSVLRRDVGSYTEKEWWVEVPEAEAALII